MNNAIKKNIAVAALLILLLPKVASSQQELTWRILVFPKSGTGMSGYSRDIRVGIEDDTLTLISGMQRVQVVMGSVARIVVLPQSRRGYGFLDGSLIGTYLSMLLIGRAQGQPGGYLEETDSFAKQLFYASLLGMAVGGTLGSALNSPSSAERVYSFDGSAQEQSRMRKSFYDLVSGEPQAAPLHLKIEGGQVYAKAKKKFEEVLPGTGNGYLGGSTDFNWLRKIQATYSFQPDLHVGLAAIWSSEPSVSNNSSAYLVSASTWTRSSQSLSVFGIYGVCEYEPFLGSIPSQIDLAIGGGVGIAKIGYGASVDVTRTDYTPQYRQTYSYAERTLNTSSVSATVYGELNLFIHESVSVGLIADYVYYPPYTIVGDPLLGLPDQSLSGNGSIGFVLGFHL